MLVRVRRIVRRAAVISAALALSGAGAAAAVLPAGSTAAASSLIPTRLLIKVTPESVTYPNPQLTITGTLETLATNGQTPQPVPGEQVSLSLSSEDGQASQPLGSFTTGAGGQVSTTVTAEVPGAVYGSFAGDGTYRQTAGAAGFKAASLLPTKVTVEPITPVPYGSNATVTAQVTMQLPDGTWVPAPGSPITVLQCGAPDTYGWTNSQGRWTTTIKAEPPTPLTGDCYFYTNGDTSDAWTSWVLSPGFFVPLATFPTQVTGFNPQSRLVPAADIVFSGTAQWTDSSGASHPYPGAAVQLQFLPRGIGDAWQRMATAKAGKDGGFVFPRVSGYLGHGRLTAGVWRAVLPASGKYVAGNSGDAIAELSVPASMSGVKIVRKGSIRYLSGTLRYPDGGLLPGAKVTLLIDRGGKVSRGASVTTSASGAFSIRLTAPKRGQRVTYAASFAGGDPAAWTDSDGYAVATAARSGWVSWA
jgi:hypothetical protein